MLLSSALILAASAAGPALAQQAPAGAAAGLRYLSWPGKPAATASAPAETSSGLRPALPAALEPSAPESYAPAVSAPAYSAPAAPQRMASNGLTPASTWLNPTASAGAQPYDYSRAPAAAVPAAPEPMREVPPPPVNNPILNPSTAAPVPSARLVQPAPAPVQPSARLVEAAPRPSSSAETAPVDPMAPRRDAPIFRIQGAQAQGQPQAEAQPTAQPAAAYQTAQVGTPPAPQAGSARYYSVHRPLGRTPDPAPQPQPVYLDALPVELISPPQSADLAEPQSGPALIRSQNGTVRAAPAPAEGDYQ